jgi:hypothetical protein
VPVLFSPIFSGIDPKSACADRVVARDRVEQRLADVVVGHEHLFLVVLLDPGLLGDRLDQGPPFRFRIVLAVLGAARSEA